nr:reverse transcriptase domain-containing protein [Tanacetum cinerariifolium]
MIRMRDEAASTSHSPPLQLPSTSHREDRPEVTLPHQKKLDIAFGPRYEKQMAPRRSTRSTADQETVNATTVTNAQLQAMIDQGVTATLAARDALRSTIGDDSHHSGMGEMALLCGRMFLEEFDKIEKYIRGLPVMIHGSVVVSKPKTMQEAVAIATELMDHKIRTFAEREIASKRKYENTSRSTQNQQQQPNKRQNTSRVYTAASGEKKQYGDLNPYALNAIITKMVHVLQNDTNATKFAILPVTVGLRNNNNHGNQGGKDNALAKVYAVGCAGTYPESNVVMVIACAEKIVRIPWGNETLIIHGDGSNKGNVTRLNIISCTKTEKYMMKGFPFFLAHITTKEVEDKSEKKRLKDVPIVQNFRELFP